MLPVHDQAHHHRLHVVSMTTLTSIFQTAETGLMQEDTCHNQLHLPQFSHMPQLPPLSPLPQYRIATTIVNLTQSNQFAPSTETNMTTTATENAGEF
jgi:hypothetical protein